MLAGGLSADQINLLIQMELDHKVQQTASAVQQKCCEVAIPHLAIREVRSNGYTHYQGGVLIRGKVGKNEGAPSWKNKSRQGWFTSNQSLSSR